MSAVEKEPAAPAKVTVADVDAKIAELTAKVEAFEAGLPGLIAAEVEKLAGPVLAKLVEGTLTPLVEKLEQATTAAEAKAEHVAGEIDARFVEHVNAKVHAIHNALQRAIGIEVPLPLLEDPVDKPVGEITVAGAETAANQP